ncbi:MAG: PstS family phosphate ABC transporter substrate-binding protein, partial [Persicimonas sp.]
MKTKIAYSLVTLAAALALTACKGKKGQDALTVDGSSTVYPITEAVAEEFQAETGARVTIGVSGTGGGFKKFCRKETMLTGASRPIKPSEVETCGENDVEYIEVPVAYDGVTVIIHPDNDWAEEMTVADLKKIWEPEAQKKITKWNQVRDEWPDKKLNLYGAGIDSGTYDYFTHATVGTPHSSRGDFTSSEDDNIIVNGVSNDESGLGFLGYAYYDENREVLKSVAIKADQDAEAVKPSKETISSGTYVPLFRPLFVYIRKDALEQNEKLAEFVEYILTEGGPLVDEVGYVALPDEGYELGRKRVADRVTGSVFGGEGSKIGVSVEELLGGDEPDPEAPAAKADEGGDEGGDEG